MQTQLDPTELKHYPDSDVVFLIDVDSNKAGVLSVNDHRSIMSRVYTFCDSDGTAGGAAQSPPAPRPPVPAAARLAQAVYRSAPLPSQEKGRGI